MGKMVSSALKCATDWKRRRGNWCGHTLNNTPYMTDKPISAANPGLLLDMILSKMHADRLAFELDAVSMAQAVAETLTVSMEDSFKVVIGPRGAASRAARQS